MKLVATVLCALVCVAISSGQTCQNLHPLVLHFGGELVTFSADTVTAQVMYAPFPHVVWTSLPELG